MTHWSEKYLNIPFVEGGRSFAGCDCGGLVLLALKHERGATPTDFKDYERADFRYPNGYNKLAQGIAGRMGEWQVVESPRPFDMARFRFGRLACHVGLYVDELHGFLHVEQQGLFSRITPWNDPHWMRNFIEFRRYRGLA